MSNETKPYAIGIDMGGTNTDIGLVDRDGHCLARKNLPMGCYTAHEALSGSGTYSTTGEQMTV